MQDFDQPHGMRTAICAPTQPDNLIVQARTVLQDTFGLTDRILLGAGNEAHLLRAQSLKEHVIQKAQVENEQHPRLERDADALPEALVVRQYVFFIPDLAWD